MRVLAAPDKFKGTLSAAEVAAAIAAGARAAGAETDPCPIADGGEGTAEILVGALGGEWRGLEAPDPLGRAVECRFALVDDGATAVVEVAEASGLWRLDPAERDPLAAGTEGTGVLIAAAVAAGAGRVLVACGGSATVDGGAGALRRFDPAAAELTCLCDTRAGWAEAASTYGPQKGASAEQVGELADRLEALADRLPHDPRRLPFTGAAGGLAGGFWAHGARLVPGARHVLDALGFERRLERADLLVTGEGRFDRSTLTGKAPGEVLARAGAAGVPAHVIAGRVELEEARWPPGLLSAATAGTGSEIAAATTRIVEGFRPAALGTDPS